MANFSKTITNDQKRFVRDTDTSSVFTLSYGDELKFTKISSSADADFKTRGVNSVWSLLNLYSNKIFDSFNDDYTNGGLLGTVWESVIDAYQSHGMIMLETTEDNWRKFIDGKNVEFKYPLDSTYTGGTSGLTATTMYSSFIDTQSLKSKSTSSFCDPIVLDTLYSEPSIEFTDSFGIGHDYQVGINPETTSNYYQSGLVLLMSNDWTPFSGTSSAKTWSSLYNIPNKYTKGAPLITPSGPTRDVASGAFFTNLGIGLIWAEDFVKGFDYASATTGGTGTTHYYFSSGATYINASEGDTSNKLQIDVILEPNEFNQSLNDSYIEDSIENGSNCDVAYNTITLHDSQGKCLVYAKSSQPVIKREGDFSIVTIDIPIDGDIQDSLADTRGCVYGSC